eukprot:comp18581_c0_seq1/m.33469 comp18581_c0_seq1/g.33469  ORF comp18581_c0_seq1/g.33469 comp18581_c0_seq1/m.33469 type:complete len:425 (+) comp18581_c0_seq1:38-1312(+)
MSANNNESDKGKEKEVVADQKDLQELTELMTALDPNKKERVHKFWDTQPVAKIDEDVAEKKIVETADNKNIRETPFDLPPGFEWFEVNIEDDAELDALFALLSNNYVEDDDSMFRFGYPRHFLKWALKPPGWKKIWHLGVRATAKKNILAFISAVPADIRVREETMKMVEINFLCVHKKLRSKRLAPVLITEITRRVNQTGVFQAVYTAGIEIPKPISKCRYYHRSLNPVKLIDVQFSAKPKKLSMQGTIKLYALPDNPTIPGIRLMERKDCKQAHALLAEYLKQFKLAPVFTLDDFVHWFLPQENLVYTYVVDNPASPGRITDMLSFYNLPSTILQHPKYDVLNAAYSYYNVAKTVPHETLVYNALILAKKTNHDVFNMLEIHNNTPVFEPLKFGPGDGYLHYYLYNYICPPITAGETGLVLM